LGFLNSYSALKMDGKPLYEYARNNIPLPRAIEARRCEVSEIAMVEWKEAGEHPYKWPTKMMSEEDSKIFQRAEHLVQQTGVVKGSNSSSLVVPPKQEAQEGTSTTLNQSSKRELPLEQEEEKESKKIRLEEQNEPKRVESEQPNDPTKTKLEEGNDPRVVKPEDGSRGAKDAQSSTNDHPTNQENSDGITMEDNGKAPVFTLEMTVSSGTYVRTIVQYVPSKPSRFLFLK
jgi:tRNA pseudouridine55 synthase